MALNLDLEPGDILIVPSDSGAQIRVVDKSGRRTRLQVESAKPVRVLKASAAPAPAPAIRVKRPIQPRG